MKEVIIIGSGPAGISAALYTLRGGIKTTIIGKDAGALSKAENIENYYGLKSPISGKELAKTGLAQALSLGAVFVQDEVVSIGFEDRLVVKTPASTYKTDSILLATGAARKTAALQNIEAFEGKGVSYCAVCDGFFFKGKDAAVLGNGDYALSEALELLPLAKSVTILTNGQAQAFTLQESSGIAVNTKKIAALTGTDVLEGVTFEDGSLFSTAGLFIAIGVASSSDLAKKIGIFTAGNAIATDDEMRTNLPGIFAAGDCTGGLLQIAKAVHEGAKAGLSVIKYLKET